jgi:hypothetical protein
MERIPTGRPILTPKEYGPNAGLPLFDSAMERQREERQRDIEEKRAEQAEIARSDAEQRSRKPGAVTNKARYHGDKNPPQSLPFKNYFFVGREPED